MSEDDKTKRAAEIDKAIREHDAKKRDDENIDPGTERGSGSSGQHLDKLLTALDTMGRMMDAFGTRMDALEKRRKDDDAHHKDDAHDNSKKRDDETEGEYKERCMKEVGVPAEAKDPEAHAAYRDAMAQAQQRADECAQAWGMRAPAPLYGESLRSFRLRCLRPFQKHSKEFSKSNLESVTDPAAFDHLERVIFNNSVAASSSPDSVEPGRLRIVTKRLPSGHIENTFVGTPHAWMDAFGGSRRFVTRINTKWSGNPE